MPITANALGRLGMNVNCVGALGYPQTHTVLRTSLQIAVFTVSPIREPPQHLNLMMAK